MNKAVEEGAAVVAECGAGIGVHAEPVLRAAILRIRAQNARLEKSFQ
jgi:hypothetical protein